VALLAAAVYLIRRVILVFVIAILFAYLLSPVVKLADRFLGKGRYRTYSLALVYAVLVGVLIVAGFLIGNTVVQETSNLATSFPHFVDSLKQKLASPEPAWLQPVKRYVLAQINERAESFGAAVLPIIQRLSTHAVAVLNSAVFVVLIPILSFFFLKDGQHLREQVLSLAGSERREMWEDILADLHLLLGQFIRALVILSMATLTAYSIFFSITGLPYAVLLASMAALLEFIPVIGPLVAAVAILLAAALAGIGHTVLILVFLVCYRLFQDYMLNPHLMSAGIELHPLLVIFGALAGEELAGIPGMFLSVPVLAALRVLYVRIRKAQMAPVRTPGS
jgi:predicted PurR-regulated permease PerM